MSQNFGIKPFLSQNWGDKTILELTTIVTSNSLDGCFKLIVYACLHQNLGERMRELVGFQGCASQERSMLADSNTTLESDVLG